MQNKIAYISLLFLVIIGALLYLYFNVEKPKQAEIANISFVNLSIYAFDTVNNSAIKTGYMLFSNGNLESIGETIPNAAILEQILPNRTISFYNVNEEGQFYYTYYNSFELLDTTPKRIDLELVPAGNLSISHNSIGNSEYLINVSADGEYRNLGMCLKWSIHIIHIDLNSSFIESQNKSKRMKYYDKCFISNITLLNNTNYNFTLKYSSFGIMDSNDYINMSFFDQDCYNGKCYFENDAGFDVAGKDFQEVIKY